MTTPIIFYEVDGVRIPLPQKYITGPLFRAYCRTTVKWGKPHKELNGWITAIHYEEKDTLPPPNDPDVSHGPEFWLDDHMVRSAYDLEKGIYAKWNGKIIVVHDGGEISVDPSGGFMEEQKIKKIMRRDWPEDWPTPISIKTPDKKHPGRFIHTKPGRPVGLPSWPVTEPGEYLVYIEQRERYWILHKADSMMDHVKEYLKGRMRPDGDPIKLNDL